MRKTIYLLLPMSLIFTGCNSKITHTAWENTKTFGRYLNEKSQALFSGEETESRAIASVDQLNLPQDDEFIPLLDEDLRAQYADITVAQPAIDQEVPIQKFKAPSQDLAAIFKRVHFNTDDDKLRMKSHIQTLARIREHLKSHPNLYVFVAGHCDDRASEDYNQALGSRRANYIRTQLIKGGVNPEQIFTISYGKELPLIKGTSNSARAKNRRVEFKIYDCQREN